MTDSVLREFPDFVESERLLLRSPRPGDGVTVRECVIASQKYLRPWMPWAVEIPSEDAYEVLMRRKHSAFMMREDLQLLMFLKESHTLIGSSGLHRIDWQIPRFEIGYWLHPDYAGYGYVTEAVLAITTFAFETLGAKRVEIRCDEQNERSAAVARRTGYQLEGVMRNEARHHLTNELRHTMLFALTRD